MASLSTCHLGLWLGWQILLLNLVVKLVEISGRAEQRGTLRGCPAQTNKGKFAGSRERALCKVFVQPVLLPRTGAARNLTFIISVYGTACWKTC